MKTCTACKEGKRAADFYTDRHAKDGLTSWCRACTKAYHSRPDIKAREAQRHKRNREARPLFDIWRGIVRRCYDPEDPAYRWYGERGVSMHDEWRFDYSAFEAGVLDVIGPRPSSLYSIDRIDTDGPYAPDNIRWATPVEQSSNRRDNLPVTYAGRTQVAAAWAREAGLNPSTFINRLHAGWDIERALTTRPRPIRRTVKPVPGVGRRAA